MAVNSNILSARNSETDLNFQLEMIMKFSVQLHLFFNYIETVCFQEALTSIWRLIILFQYKFTREDRFQ